jgi:hypothetical protein
LLPLIKSMLARIVLSLIISTIFGDSLYPTPIIGLFIGNPKVGPIELGTLKSTLYVGFVIFTTDLKLKYLL